MNIYHKYAGRFAQDVVFSLEFKLHNGNWGFFIQIKLQLQITRTNGFKKIKIQFL